MLIFKFKAELKNPSKIRHCREFMMDNPAEAGTKLGSECDNNVTIICIIIIIIEISVPKCYNNVTFYLILFTYFYFPLISIFI